eukprot:s13_g3.t1
MSAKALVLCDAAAVHGCSVYEKIRERFEQEANAILLHGGSSSHHSQKRVGIPGGWGATGAPNDAWHQWYHYIRRAFMRAHAGVGASTPLRLAMEELDLAPDGNNRMTFLERLNIEASIQADVFALRKLTEYSNGKLILWGWASRGLISMEWIADLYHDGNVEAAIEALSGVKGQLSKLCQFNELPIVDGAEYKEDDTQPMLEGEVLNFWAISDPNNDSEPIPLPLWTRASIDRAILKWRNLATQWEEKLARRVLDGKPKLPPKQQKLYDEFTSTNARSIVFDKRRNAEVMNFASKSPAMLKKHCLLIVINMSEKAEELRVTTGCGKQWKLQLLQQSQPVSDVIPKEVDHFSGLMAEQVSACDGDDDAADAQSQGDPSGPALRMPAVEKQAEYVRLKDLGLHVRPHG